MLKLVKWAAKLQQMHDEIMKDKPDYYNLIVIGTEQCITSRGDGKKVMKRILDIADKEKKSTHG